MQATMTRPRKETPHHDRQIYYQANRFKIDWRAAIVFRNKIVAEDDRGNLWQLCLRRWRPLIAIESTVRGRKSRHDPLKNFTPQKQHTDEKSDRGERGSLSGDMAKHGEASRLSLHTDGKNFPSG